MTGTLLRINGRVAPRRTRWQGGSRRSCSRWRASTIPAWRTENCASVTSLDRRTEQSHPSPPRRAEPNADQPPGVSMINPLRRRPMCRLRSANMMAGAALARRRGERRCCALILQAAVPSPELDSPARRSWSDRAGSALAALRLGRAQAAGRQYRHGQAWRHGPRSFCSALPLEPGRPTHRRAGQQ